MLKRQPSWLWLVASVLILPLSGITNARAAEYHVAPKGSAEGTGEIGTPWDLPTALSGTQAIAPGDTILLHGGIYRGGLVSELIGTEDEPIVVRGAPGERVVLDLHSTESMPDAHFYVRGEHAIYRDFEATCSDPKRTTTTAGPYAEDVNRGGISCHGTNIKFINLVVHDLKTGFQCWSEGTEIYGCIIYNHGWSGPRRGYGDGIYSRTGRQRFVDNIIFNQFGRGINCFASTDSSLEGLQIGGNVSFGNGSLSKPGHQESAIFVGSSAKQVQIIANSIYAGGIRCGSPDEPHITGMSIDRNYIAGSLAINNARDLTVRYNTIVGEGTIVRLEDSEKLDTASFTWNENTYFLPPSKYAPFNVSDGEDNTSYKYEDWIKAARDTSRCQHVWPTENSVFVRPNRFESGRAHVIVYNWRKDPTVKLDLSTVLRKGRRFEILSAQNLRGKAVASGVYNGESVEISMRPSGPAKPVGMEDYVVPVTEPEFGVFVVRSADQLPR